ncbi:serine/threonine-protein kinase [Streptomyces sp. NPDC002004]
MSEAEQAGESRQDKSSRLLAGRYRLGEVLGRGGMGTVWRAKDETLGRTVAVKELRFPGSIDEEEKRRLVTRTLREAKAIARIRNNGAVTVYDVVQEDDRPWIVMELVEGKSLAEAIREDGLLTPRRAAEVGLAILDVLRAAHREGILHRDVKPSNVLIAEDGRVVLTDFGIAQVEGDPSITSTGMLVGAPSYISPERARGHKPGPAADLWSLGGLLYASVEGVPPYDKGSAIATLTAVMTEPVDPPKNAGPLEEVIYGLLAKDPAQRLDDAGARALLNVVIHEPEPKEAAAPEAPEATKVVPIPPAPEERSAARVSGAAGLRKSEEAAERLRGALRSARKAAAATASSALSKSAAQIKASPGAGSDGATKKAGASGTGTGSGTGAGSGSAAASASGAANGGRSGSVPRTPPKASLTDVVPRRTLVIIAVIVALVVIGTVLALTLNGGDGTAAGGGHTDKAASTGATAGSGSGKGKNGSTGDRTQGQGKGAGQSATQTDDQGKDGSDDSSDDGDDKGGQDGGKGNAKGAGDAAVTTYKAKQGFSIGLPKGWSYKATDYAGARFTGPDGQKLLIGWTSTPKDDPVQDWRNQEGAMVRPQYHKIRIEAVGYRSWKTADWEFTYVDGGTKYRSVDRGFVVNSHQGYGMMYTARAGDWGGDQRRTTWQTFTRTFQPKS